MVLAGGVWLRILSGSWFYYKEKSDGLALLQRNSRTDGLEGRFGR